MQSHEVRERFLTFFSRQGHAVVPSDSLIPSGDPTVLFTSAGMNQFKDYFLGKRTDLTRAASCQKCLRTGDLERVGKTASHHTFFEMLGNFSFGDYFKREAIAWAWEFLTQDIQLPKNKLWVTVFEDDAEAEQIWKTQIKVPAHKIVRLGEADNFWPANARTQGPNGPCGPCSEVHFDRTGKCLTGRADCMPGCDCGRFVEVWNLVFTQFDRQEGGQLVALPRKHIDTGMGLERLVCVIQGTETDYETDLFTPLLEAIRRLPRGRKAKRDQLVFAERAIADHFRAMVFLIAEGVLPSNESRGYVLRMLIRRAYRLGRAVLDFEVEPGRSMLAPLIDSVEKTMQHSPYAKALAAKRQMIQRAIEQEETQFVDTLESGMAILETMIAACRKANRHVIAGEETFKLYDTYGFPLELTVDIAGEHGFTVDRAGFDTAFKAQQARSRAASQFGQGIFIPTTLRLGEDIKPEFVGYQTLQADAVVKGIWKAGEWAKQAQAGDEVGVILDRSPCYGESGGQVGDQGVIEAPKGTLEVLDTKWADELLVHHAKVKQGTVAVNDPVRAHVNAERRLKVARSHTATHLLHWALRKVLGDAAVQAGSLVEAERVRFDFSSLGGLRDEQRAKVEQLVNDRVRASDGVKTDDMELDEAKRLGALALFGEKYGRRVRVVSIGDYSHELCGGTHLVHTGLIGTFRIIEESSIAAGTRRIEAIVGATALERQQQESQLLRQLAERFSRPPHEALQGLEELFQQLRTAEKHLKTLKQELAKIQAKQLVAEAKRIDGVTVVTAQIDGADRDLLASLADAITSSLTSGVAVLASKEDAASVAWVMAVTADLVKRGVHAGELLKTISAITKGGGGGRPDFAQAGGKDPSRITEALKQTERFVREAIKR